jgi:hypothetical protein
MQKIKQTMEKQGGGYRLTGVRLQQRVWGVKFLPVLFGQYVGWCRARLLFKTH